MENFEEKLSRLEELSEKIKRSDISLEEAVKTFEEGIKLSKGLEAELGKIESKVQILMNQPLEMDEELEEDSKTSKGKKAKKIAEPEFSLFTMDDEQ